MNAVAAPQPPARAAAPEPQPLSREHIAQLAAARRAARPILRAATAARVSAWTTGVCGGLTLVGVVWGSAVSGVLGLGLIVIAVREGRLARAIGALDERAGAKLALNQMLLGALIVGYAAWQVHAVMTGQGPAVESTGDPRMDAVMADIQEFSRQVMAVFYVVVAVVGAASTGLMALYYRARARAVRRFRRETQEWIVRVMETA